MSLVCCQMDIMSLNNDDDYMSEHEDSEQEMDENNPVVDESLMSTAEMVKGKHKRRHSKCWNYFTIEGDKMPDGKFKCVCNYCKHYYFLDLHKSGTNTLLRHSRLCSKTPGSALAGAKKIDQMVFREMIAVAIVEHDLPYAFVEFRRVREAFLYVNPTVKFWCRNTAVSDVFKIFEREKMKLRQVLSEVPGRICLTTDLWRAITIEGYLCLTAHYIDPEWNLRAKILSFCAFPPPHSGLAIAMKLMELIKEWGLQKKVFTVTVDNASSNDNMQGFLKRQLRKDLVCSGEFFHIRCAAHILNLIVQDGLSVISEALEKIRDSVKYVKVTESRELLFQGCVETVGIIKKGGLVLDVTTRWNSTYLMLSKALYYKEAFKNLAEIETSYQSLPTELEWLRAGLICGLLEPFYQMTKLISGSSYPTANLYFMEVWKIQSWLGSNEFCEDEVVCEMVASMKVKFNKYWDEYSDILAIAAVLDPRMKFKVLEYCYHSLDPASCKSKMDYIRKKIVKLYGVYKKKSTSAQSSQEAETDALPAGYGGFYAFFTQQAGTGKSALDVYLSEPVLDMLANTKLDVIKYWKENSSRFKELSQMACDVLCIPITTVSSESSFSVGNRVLSKYRSRLLPSNVEALICARNWLRGYEVIGEC